MNGYISRIVSGNDLGAYNAATNYVRKDVCTYNNLKWICMTGSVGEAPQGSTKWRAYIEAGTSGVSLQQVYPVGCIYTSTVATNPATVFGFGTWTAFGTGRTLVGFDSGQAEFDAVEETGGSKTHTLQITEIPAHTHGMLSLTAATGAVASYEHGTVDATSTASAESSAATGSTGGGGAHNNLQPYIVVYFWKRTV